MATSAVNIVDSPSTIRPMLKLAAPICAEMILHMMVGLSDTALTGKYLSEVHLAAINTTSYSLWLFAEFIVFVSLGTTAVVARFAGAKKQDQVQSALDQSFFLGGVLSIVSVVGGLLFIDPFVDLMNLTPDASGFAKEYMRAIIPTLPFLMLMTISLAGLRGIGDMKTGMWVMAIVNFTNVVVSWTLVSGCGYFEPWGWQGIYTGTFVSFSVGGLLILFLFLKKRGQSGLFLTKNACSPDYSMIKRILKIGIPGGMDIMCIILCQLWYLSIINKLGPIAAGAHGIAIKVEAFAYMPGGAFQVAAATMVGQHLGAKNYDRASHSANIALMLGGAIMVSAGTFFFFNGRMFCEWLVSADKVAVVDQAVVLLKIVATAMPALSVVMIYTGALRGAGDTKSTFLIAMAGNLIVRIPLAYYLTQDFGIEGAWIAMASDLYLRSILVSFRYFRGGWKKIEV